MRYLALGLVLLASLGSLAEAQGPPLTQTLDSGTLERVRLDSGSTLRGRLVTTLEPGAQQLQLCLYPGRDCSGAADSRVRGIEMSAITRLEVSAGSRWRTGALIGGILGIAAGGLAYGLDSDTDAGSGPAGPAAVYYIRGTLGGALWGALFGAGFDAWRPPR